MLRPAGTLLPEKRKVGSSTLPLTTSTSTGIPAPERGFRCSVDRYGSIYQECRGVPRNAVLSVGYLWGGSGTPTCGIFVGTPEAFVGSRSRPLMDFALRLPGTGSRLGRRGLATDSRG